MLSKFTYIVLHKHLLILNNYIILHCDHLAAAMEIFNSYRKLLQSYETSKIGPKFMHQHEGVFTEPVTIAYSYRMYVHVISVVI